MAPSMDRNDRLAAYYKRGFSLRETAVRFKLTMSRVHQIIRDYYPELMRKPYDTTQHSTGAHSGTRANRKRRRAK
jgi:hypothetical protein